MVDLTLRGQSDEANRLLRGGRADTAITIGQRILENFPRHIETYSMLGHACLQRGQVQVAIDLFRRVLSADPEHVYAYIGLARAYQEDNALEDALWHLERAFEMVPGSRTVRRNLRQLYEASGLVPPERIKLSRAGLARTYLRGRLYTKAAEELQTLLADLPDRYDLRVALAEALWQLDRFTEASGVCQQILTSTPFCLKANLVLGQIWLGSPREAEGRTLLQRAQTLDPENNTAQALFGRRSPLPPRAPRLTQREEDYEPLDLPYLQAAADEVEDEQQPKPSDQVPEEEQSSSAAAPDHARPARETSPLSDRLASLLRGARALPEIEVPLPPTEEEAREDSSVAEADLPEEPVSPPAETPEGMSLLDLRQQYVEEHPDDWRARLDLARRYRDIGHMADALTHYDRLIEYDYESLPEVTRDLEFLNRIYPGTTPLIELLLSARERGSQPPPAAG